MRAIIECTTDTPSDHLQKILGGYRLLPPFEQNDPMVVDRRNEILDLVSGEDREVVRRTSWFMIYHHRTRSWGLVNSPSEGVVEFRIRNRDATKLQAACDKLVFSLQDYEHQQKIKNGQMFSFAPIIEVLEPNSQHHAFYGEVLPLNHVKLQVAIDERKNEWRVGQVAIIVAILLAIFTIPPIEEILILYLPQKWEAWTVGNIARLATSAVVTSSVSFLNVILHWLRLRRLGSVRWILK